MVIEVTPVQSRNACCPMLATLSGIVRLPVRPEQPRNALSPMPVTLSGMVTEVSPVQPENA